MKAANSSQTRGFNTDNVASDRKTKGQSLKSFSQSPVAVKHSYTHFHLNGATNEKQIA